MNKAELVDAISSEAKITKADATRALEAFMNATTKSLKKGERVALVAEFAIDFDVAAFGDDAFHLVAAQHVEHRLHALARAAAAKLDGPRLEKPHVLRRVKPVDQLARIVEPDEVANG